MYPNTAPWNSLPPLRVITLITPPDAWPYSASNPPVLTWVSLMKSAVTPVPSDPNWRENEPMAPKPAFEAFTPSMMKLFSRPLAPPIDGFDLPA
jgi:hypothetical protein